MLKDLTFFTVKVKEVFTECIKANIYLSAKANPLQVGLIY